MRHKLQNIFTEAEIKTKLKALSKELEIELTDIIYLKAMTHRSFVYGDASEAVEDNERLEFVGDGVANMIVGAYLYNQYPDWNEGDLSQAKSILVSEKVFSQSATSMNLGAHLILSQTEEQAGARNKPSVLEDAFEAFIGAHYITKGLESCIDIFERYHFPRIYENLNNPNLLNGKSLLMELCQKNKWPNPEYVLLGETGLEHEKIFKFQVIVGDQVLGESSGYSKKAVQKEIALAAYLQLKNQKLETHDFLDLDEENSVEVTQE